MLCGRLSLGLLSSALSVILEFLLPCFFRHGQQPRHIVAPSTLASTSRLPVPVNQQQGVALFWLLPPQPVLAYPCGTWGLQIPSGWLHDVQLQLSSLRRVRRGQPVGLLPIQILVSHRRPGSAFQSRVQSLFLQDHGRDGTVSLCAKGHGDVVADCLKGTPGIKSPVFSSWL